nr:hypothetical protein [Tanacetum cinerariifolium]
NIQIANSAAIQCPLDGGVTEWYQEPKIIMVNIIPPDHVDDVPIVEPNQHDNVLVVPEPVLEDEDEDPKEEEFEEEEDDPQKEEDDMESELDDVIEVENPIEHEDKTVHASVHEYGTRNDCNGEAVEKLGSAEDKVECKKLKKELEEARIMPPKTAPLTQAAIRRMIKESVDATINTERARKVNAGNNARGSGPVRGQDAAPDVCNGYSEKGQKQSKTDKTKHGNGKIMKSQSRRCVHLILAQVTIKPNP